MPKIYFNPDAGHAYNFEPDDQAVVGFVTSFKIGTQTLATDVRLKPPTRSATPTSYCGVIEKVDWNGGASDSMTFHFRVSTANHHTIVNLSHSATTDIDVEAVFSIYDYDTKALEYFEALKTDPSGIKGEIKLSTDGQTLSVKRPGDGEGQKVPGVDDWYVSVVIEPYVGVNQVLHFATAKNKALTKKWGKPAETGTGSGTSESSSSSSSGSSFPAVSTDSSETSALRDELAALRKRLGTVEAWLAALTDEVDIKFQAADGLYATKTNPQLLRQELKTKLQRSQKTIQESRQELQ